VGITPFLLYTKSYNSHQLSPHTQKNGYQSKGYAGAKQSPKYMKYKEIFMSNKYNQKSKFSFEKTLSLYQNPLVPQIQTWLRDIENKAKIHKTGKISIKIDLFED
jgi:hypothetical protein